LLTYTTSDNPGKQQVLYLLNTDGNWLVQFSKNDAISGNKKGGDTADTTGGE